MLSSCPNRRKLAVNPVFYAFVPFVWIFVDESYTESYHDTLVQPFVRPFRFTSVFTFIGQPEKSAIQPGRTMKRIRTVIANDSFGDSVFTRAFVHNFANGV